MIQIGLKLWSTNLNFINEAQNLFNNNFFQYLELYSVPNSYNKYIQYWKQLSMPIIIHAPHFMSGLNLADHNNVTQNKVLASEAFLFADVLRAKSVIFHPGINGTIDETINQLTKIYDKRILIENKPFYGLNNEHCNGYSPEDIHRVMKETKVGFCLDIGHAIYAANAQKINSIDYLHKFIELKPAVFHLTDGDFSGIHDQHDHYGEGSFPLNEIAKLIPDDCMLTNEAKKNSEVDLSDFQKDIQFLRTILLR